MAKQKLRLLTSKHVKKVYGKVILYLCDDTVHPFSLDEWDMYEDQDAIEFRKLNKQSVEIFFTHNIMRIVFDKSDTKLEVSPTLKPVA